MRIAFVSAGAYDQLHTQAGNVGGAERQQLIVGRGLAERGHDIFFVERSQPDRTEGTVEGVKVRLVDIPTRGNTIARAWKWKNNLFELLDEIDPDICFRSVHGYDVPFLAHYARKRDARFVYNFAHDQELVADDPFLSSSRILDSRTYRFLRRKALRSSDMLIAQNQYQFENAIDQFGKPVELIPYSYPIEEAIEDSSPKNGVSQILWVSRLVEWKQPELIFPIADAFPDIEFVIVGPKEDEEPAVYETVIENANKRDNVRYEGYVQPSEINKFYASADLFLNTSTAEGFPNTFLESWAHHTPVMSLNVDPSGIIQEQKIGGVGDGSVDALVTAIEEYVNDPEFFRDRADAAFKYVSGQHNTNKIVEKYEQVFETVA